LYLLHLIKANDKVAIGRETWLSGNCFWHCVLPEDGTLVPKHAADAQLMFVPIKTVQLVGTINDVRWERC